MNDTLNSSIRKQLCALVCILCCSSFSPAFASFVITLNYTGDAQFASSFSAAKATWESKLSGYQNGVVVSTSAGSSYTVGQTIDQLFINASVVNIDGVGDILGSAGPTARARDQLGFTLATNGTMNFDAADVANLLAQGRLEAVILHEMAHVMGFGTLWEENGLYTAGSGEFLGANATLAWQRDYGQTGTPDVELGGGSGTANGHWNEVNNGAGPTGIVDALGRDMRDEIMTGWLNGNAYISDMTVQSFVDIGFRVTAVPEPNSLALLGLTTGFLLLRRRQARQLA